MARGRSSEGDQALVCGEECVKADILARFVEAQSSASSAQCPVCCALGMDPPGSVGFVSYSENGAL